MAVLVKENGGAWNIYYLGRDYQGSITHLRNASGTVVQELSYDPWGRLRNPANQELFDLSHKYIKTTKSTQQLDDWCKDIVSGERKFIENTHKPLYELYYWDKIKN